MKREKSGIILILKFVKNIPSFLTEFLHETRGEAFISAFQSKNVLFLIGNSIKWCGLLIAAGILAIGWVYSSFFVAVCGGCAVLFVFLQFIIGALAKKDANVQHKGPKQTGFFLALAAMALLASGIWFLFYPDISVPLVGCYILIVLSAGMAVCFAVQFLVLLRNKSLCARFLRLNVISAMSVPASLVVVLLLNIAQVDSLPELSSMSIIAFAGGAFLVALNLIVVALCGYKSTADSIKEVSGLMKNKKMAFTRAKLVKDVCFVIGKAIISVISLSFFMFVNALYSAGMGVARFIAIKMYSQNKQQQTKSYRYVGIIISAASICYMLYSVRLFLGEKSSVYNMNIALLIALYTFIEFGINMRDAFRLRKSHALEAKALRAISFASTMLCFVLTQTAIMSFANEGDSSFSNALSGIVFGGLALLIGLYVIFDSIRYGKMAE